MKASKKKTKGAAPARIQKVRATGSEPVCLGISSPKLKKLIARFPAPLQFAEQEPTMSWVLPYYYGWCSESNPLECSGAGSDEACLLANVLGQALAAVRDTISDSARESNAESIGTEELCFMESSASLLRGERNAIISRLRMEEIAPDVYRLYHSELASIRKRLEKHDLSLRFWRAFELSDIVLEAFWQGVQARYESGGSIPAKLAQARRPGRQFTCASLPTPKA